MENITQNHVIGITGACRVLQWSSGKFGGYYYKGKAPACQMIDNKPVWLIEDLLKWKPETGKFQNIRKKKPPCEGIS